MRKVPLMAFAGLLVMTAPAIAQVPNTLMSGTIQAANGTNSGDFCAVQGGASTFHNGAFDFALMTFGPIYYWAGSVRSTTAYTLNGQVQLNFSSGTTGYMKFINNAAIPVSVAQPEFAKFSEVYHTQSQRLIVTFNILFPGCTLPISATFQN